jgi:hypothetical protein
LAVAEYSINMGYCILLKDTIIPAKISRNMKRIMREAIHIELHPRTSTERMDSPYTSHGRPHTYTDKMEVNSLLR